MICILAIPRGRAWNDAKDADICRPYCLFTSHSSMLNQPVYPDSNVQLRAPFQLFIHCLVNLKTFASEISLDQKN